MRADVNQRDGYMGNEWERRYEESVAAEAAREAARLAAAPRPQRAMVAFFSTFGMACRLVVLPLYLYLTVRAVMYLSFASVVLGIVLLMLFGFSVFRTTDVLQRRRAMNRNWLTGLPRPS
jgi:hypothetical protein